VSALADRRYSDPEYEHMRRTIDAFITCGGWFALCEEFDVSSRTLENWRIGVTAPTERTRDLIVDFIRRKVAA
jgi:hypothetical protein